MLLVTLAFIVLLLTGMPVAFAIGISGFLFFLQNPNLPVTIPIQLSISQTQNFALLAVPMFILAGNLMNGAGITRRLLDLSNVLVGHMRGSLAQVNVLLSTLMGGVSGSSTCFFPPSWAESPAPASPTPPWKRGCSGRR